MSDDGPIKWYSDQNPTLSVLNWTADGHRPLQEIREEQIARIAAFEAQVIAATEDLRLAQSEVEQAIRKRDAAYTRRQSKRTTLKKAKEDLIKLFPDSPEEI